MHATSFASHSSISFAFEAIEQLFLHNFFFVLSSIDIFNFRFLEQYLCQYPVVTEK